MWFCKLYIVGVHRTQFRDWSELVIKAKALVKLTYTLLVIKHGNGKWTIYNL